MERHRSDGETAGSSRLLGDGNLGSQGCASASEILRSQRPHSVSTPPTPGSRSLRGDQLSDFESEEEDVQTVHLRFYSMLGDVMGDTTYTLNAKEADSEFTLGNILAKARLLTHHPFTDVIIMGRGVLCSKKPYMKIRDFLDGADIVPHPGRKGGMSTTFVYRLSAQVVLATGRHI